MKMNTYSKGMRRRLIHVILFYLLEMTTAGGIFQHILTSQSSFRRITHNYTRLRPTMTNYSTSQYPRKLTTPILSCDFDTGSLCPSLELEKGGDFDWKIGKGATPNKNTGPFSDASPSGNGYYIYIDSNKRLNGYFAQFHTKWLKLRIHRRRYNYCLKFKYHMRGLTTGSLSVYFQDIQNKNILKFRMIGEKGNQWMQARIPLRGMKEKMRIMFKAKTSFGYTSDIAVDSIQLEPIYSQPCWTWPGIQIEEMKKQAVSPEYGPENRSTCGIQGPMMNKVNRKNIIEGDHAKPGEWPWMAMLCKKNSNSNFCGGTLLGNQWIVTAAHCVFNTEDPSDVHVRLGAYKNPSEHAENFEIDKIFIHPSYNGGETPVKYNFDVALLKLKTEVKMNDVIRSICLPNCEKELPKGKVCHVTGWGKLGRDGRAAKILRKGEVEIQDWQECKLIYGKSNLMILTKSMMCAGKRSGRITDTCNGDSGGPLVYQKDTKQWVLGGITSWGDGNGCGNASVSGVYTNVVVVQDWIKGIIKYEPDDNRLLFEKHKRDNIPMFH